MFIVIEIQTTDNCATLVNTFTDRTQAESKYHLILASAAISAIPKHGAVMLTEEGERLKSECYYHLVEEPEGNEI